jgi:uncharacterized membrane protein YtjA (UPF0391 family)
MSNREEAPLPGWSSTFLLLTIAAAVFGFTGEPTIGVARILFFVFLVLAVASELAESLPKKNLLSDELERDERKGP